MTSSMRIWRRMMMPDLVRVHRYQSLPEQGPKVLFFSGGSALNKISRVFKEYTHHSVHLVTPFDSGGSSARLRAEFDIPAVGDLRSRLMALADETVMGQPEVYDLFTHRLPQQAEAIALREQLQLLVLGEHPLIECIPNPMKALIQTHLAVTQDCIHADFDLRGASIGNLIMAGGYLNNHHQLDPIVFLFSRLVKALGEVKTTLDASLHLGVELDNGDIVLGQHRITGKETNELPSPIKRMWLNKGLRNIAPTNCHIADDRKDAIEAADLICYPPGSFYSSLLANLLPEGVGRSICQNPNPKVYLPNLGTDPEQQGLSLMERVKRLVSTVMADTEMEAPYSALDYLLLDDSYNYGELDSELLGGLNVVVIRTPLITEKKHKYDERLVAKALLSFV
ncbi:GAK system CofD-like protein [Marinomonas rhizomae]|uniref:CofD-related protein of GAK system n=1 Tax=Marinomonas rhizomae TaxID=491948 RepID=A0A366J4I1_9GAMM|nr:GAK system CofD-like protein [Marinomonas rhizomae]RBP81164.1 CofD-related protein of GAK system [Marinomonas rhizomae]RNF72321.1 GAK system CofD-like protein [Marinomonas rhizomae]